MATRRHVTVCIGTDDNLNRALVRSAARLALDMGTSLRVVHAHEPLAPMFRASLLDQPCIPELRQSEAALRWREQERLRDCTELVHNVPVSSAFLRGPVGQMLSRDLRDFPPRLCIMGMQALGSTLDPLGFAVGRTVLAETSVPVLFVPDGGTSAGAHDLRILVGDDLRHENPTVLRQSLDLLNDAGGGLLVETHVYHRRWFAESFREQAFARSRIKKALTERIAHTGVRPAANVEIRSMALRGHPMTALRKAVDRIDANIIALGRHRFFHTEDLSFGTVSLRHVDEFGIPVFMAAA